MRSSSSNNNNSSSSSQRECGDTPGGDQSGAATARRAPSDAHWLPGTLQHDSEQARHND